MKVQKKFHSLGRSMIEMIAVLAVIGILSIAATYGYQIAMRHHKANEILNDVRTLGADVIHRNVRYHEDAIIIANAKNEGFDQTIPNILSVIQTDEYVFAVVVHDLDPKVCRVLLNKASEVYDRIDVGFDPVTFNQDADICGEEDTQMFFYFSTIADRLAESELCDNADETAACCYAKHGSTYVWSQSCGCKPKCEGECAYFDSNSCTCTYYQRKRASNGSCCVGEPEPVSNYVSANCESCEEGSLSDLTKSCCFYNFGQNTAGWICGDSELNTAGKNCCIKCNSDNERWAAQDKTCCSSGKVTSETGKCCPSHQLAARNHCCDNSIAGANSNEDCCSVYTTPNATGIPTRYHWSDGHCCQILYHWDNEKGRCVK